MWDQTIAETLNLSELGMVVLLALTVAVLALLAQLLSTRRQKRTAPPAPQPESTPTPRAAPTATAPESIPTPAPVAPLGPVCVQCKLIRCDDQTAAIIIAIVADTLGDAFIGKQVTSIRQL